MELSSCWAPARAHRALWEEAPAAVPDLKDSGTATTIVSLNGAYSWTSLRLPFRSINTGLKTDTAYW